MTRPTRAVCFIALGVAVLVGCAKKSKKEEATAENTNTTPPAVNPNAKPGQPGPAQPPAGRSSGVYTAEGGAPITPPVVTPPPGPKTGGETTLGTGPVVLTQCRFDKVEAALTAAKGKVVLVDCWAVWCPPCVASFPKLVEKHEKYKDKGLVCLTVSLDAGRNAPDKVLGFLKQRNATFQNFYLTDLRGDSPAMDKRFGEVSGIPHAVVFNKKGERVWTGHPMDGGLVAKLETELAK